MAAAEAEASRKRAAPDAAAAGGDEKRPRRYSSSSIYGYSNPYPSRAASPPAPPSPDHRSCLGQSISIRPHISRRATQDKAAAAAEGSTKRAAPDGGACPGKKRYNFSSIYDYDKLGVLGEGAYGVVMHARHRRTGQEVAVKWIRDIRVGDDDVRAVVREAGCLTACRGAPAVLQIRDVAASATGDLFIVTELVDGGTLRDQLSLAVTRRFTEPRARVAMRQLLRGVASVHAAGVIHRDIKPDNVLVGRDGALKICDFGLATPAHLPFPEEDPSRVGTMWYRAPELVMGRRRYGSPVDMWALGCVMFELLTGQLLFADVETEDDLLREMLRLRHEMEADGVAAFKGLPSDLSQDAGELLCGLLCFDEDERITTAEGLKHRWFSENAEDD